MRPSSDPVEPLGLERLYSGPDQCVARYGTVLILIAGNEPTPTLLERQGRWLEGFPRSGAKRSGFIVVLRPEAPPPGDEARSVIHRFYNRFSHRIEAGAMVIEGSGFRAAALRSATSFIALAARFPYPIKAFSSVREAATWLDQKLDGERTWKVAGLCAAVDELRESYARKG